MNANISLLNESNQSKKRPKGSQVESRCSNKNEPSVSNSVIKAVPQTGFF